MPGFPDLSSPLYQQLHKLAGYRLRNNPNQSLQPTLLVNEAYIRLAEQGRTWNNRTDFVKAAARVMRFAVVDHIRAKMAEKRGGKVQKVDIQMTLPGPEADMDAEEVLTLHRALDDMAVDYPAHVEMVTLRYFGGCTVKEVAEAQGVSVSKVERDLRFARAWLFKRISQL